MDTALTLWWPLAVGVLVGLDVRLGRVPTSSGRLTHHIGAGGMLHLGRVALAAVPLLWVLVTRWAGIETGGVGIGLFAVVMLIGVGAMGGVLLTGIYTFARRLIRR